MIFMLDVLKIIQFYESYTDFFDFIQKNNKILNKFPHEKDFRCDVL